MERCGSCGRRLLDHFRGECPRMDTHVVIDAGTLRRMQATGHPRLLKNVLAGCATDGFANVHIEAVNVREEA